MVSNVKPMLVASSVLTRMLAAQVNAGGTAPWFSIRKRDPGVWLQWLAVLPIALLRAQHAVHEGNSRQDVLGSCGSDHRRAVQRCCFSHAEPGADTSARSSVLREAQ